MTSSLKIARYTALGALFLIPFTPLIVLNDFFFPFITGKAFYFRLLVEILVAAWAALAVLDAQYRPRFSWIGGAVTAFVVWMFIADLAAVNATKALWSNFERMEGWILLIHLLGFFVAAGAVLRVEKKWRTWFMVSLGVSVLILFHALFQLFGWVPIHQGSIRIDASLGNSAYLAIYLLFNTFIAGWLAFTEQNVALRRALIVLAAIEGLFIFFTETRGTSWGLIGALLLTAILVALTHGAKSRKIAIIGFVVVALFGGSLFLARNTSFVQNSHALQRISSVSLADLKVRFMIWGEAWQGFKERPVVGWGQEGFNYVFNAHYNPAMYEQEPWFDRAHNAFIDWLSAGGLPAFLLFLSLFVLAITALWRSEAFSRAEQIALTAAIVGYAFHDLFVFDNLYSYVYFFAILAYIDSKIARPFKSLEGRVPEEAGAVVLPIALATCVVVMYLVNASGIRTATSLITALQPPQGVAQSITVFKDLLTRHSFADQEVREQLVSLSVQASQSQNVPNELKQQIATYAIEEMQKQIELYPEDAREHLQLALAYRVVGDTQSALKEMEAARALSPNKEQTYVQEGALLWEMGDTQNANAAFMAAYNLGPQFPDLAAYAAAGMIAIGNTEGAKKTLLTTFGTTTVDNEALIFAYQRTKDYPDLIDIFALRASKPHASVQDYFTLASGYYVAGDRAHTLAVLEKALTLFPEAAAQIQAGLKELQGAK